MSTSDCVCPSCTKRTVPVNSVKGLETVNVLLDKGSMLTGTVFSKTNVREAVRGITSGFVIVVDATEPGKAPWIELALRALATTAAADESVASEVAEATDEETETDAEGSGARAPDDIVMKLPFVVVLLLLLLCVGTNDEASTGS